jgi:two-component sensor histidine kinase/PAS domain-containing protein
MREITPGLGLFYIDVPLLRPGTIGAYLLAFMAVVVATTLRLAIAPYVHGLEFATFLPAVIITALISGLGAGLFSVALSIAATALFVLPPRLSLYVEQPGDVLALLLYTVVMLFSVALIAGMRRAVEQALRASRDRLQFALDAALLGWWQYDPIRGVAWSDTRLKEMFDIAEDTIDVLGEFKRRVHPDDIDRVWAAVEAAIDPTNPKPYATEYRLRRRDGGVRWIEAHAFVHFEGSRRERRAVSMVGTAQDITERKLREERERLLMREVNHRAKNMLSLVQAIARQTAAREPPDFIERFTERVRALGANQDVLIRNEWHGVDVKDLVRAQLAHFADLGSRVAAHGPELRLNAAAAQSIGLAMHERATNAGKYGALSTDRGRVDISWRIDCGTFSMSWVECDGPPVSAPKRRGFGIVVMEAMVERSLDGKVDLDYAPSGLAWRLTCPAASSLEHPRG